MEITFEKTPIKEDILFKYNGYIETVEDLLEVLEYIDDKGYGNYSIRITGRNEGDETELPSYLTVPVIDYKIEGDDFYLVYDESKRKVEERVEGQLSINDLKDIIMNEVTSPSWDVNWEDRDTDPYIQLMEKRVVTSEVHGWDSSADFNFKEAVVEENFVRFR